MAMNGGESVEIGLPTDPEMGVPARSSRSSRQPSRAPIEKKKTSGLDTHDDPFALREGKTLTWRDMNMTLVSSNFVDARCDGYFHSL